MKTKKYDDMTEKERAIDYCNKDIFKRLLQDGVVKDVHPFDYTILIHCIDLSAAYGLNNVRGYIVEYGEDGKFNTVKINFK